MSPTPTVATYAFQDNVLASYEGREAISRLDMASRMFGSRPVMITNNLELRVTYYNFQFPSRDRYLNFLMYCADLEIYRINRSEW